MKWSSMTPASPTFSLLSLLAAFYVTVAFTKAENEFFKSLDQSSQEGELQLDVSGCFNETNTEFIVIGSNNTDFINAKARCMANHQATLARISSIEENEFVKELILTSQVGLNSYIGLLDFNETVNGEGSTFNPRDPGRFRFVDLSTEGLSFFRKENGIEPWDIRNPTGVGDCVAITNEDLRWRSTSCGASRPYVCRRSCTGSSAPSTLPTTSAAPPSISSDVEIDNGNDRSKIFLHVIFGVCIIAMSCLIGFALFKYKTTMTRLREMECKAPDLELESQPEPERRADQRQAAYIGEIGRSLLQLKVSI